ncbi:hypothetical protein MO867_12730 [Microbulbifer sp. OS29]|uniref:Lipoprotein n=1 Tax=Microbulbifer okhotskensis TaxID=2926617 RepID=A0A9X2ESZ1_9GAMM|nr:hypothetical protein [Microbulbifer okhotskensis]MCO1335198.1 hypothetical protein [Microbulbifer okhotskensis]
MRAIGLLCLCLLAGCSSVVMVRHEPIQGAQQEKRLANGWPIISSQKRYKVEITPYDLVGNANGNTSYLLAVKNINLEPVTVGTENISATFISETEKHLKVLDYYDLLYELELKAARRQSGNKMSGLGAALEAAGAGATGNTQGQFVAVEKARQYRIDNEIAALELENAKIKLAEEIFQTRTIAQGEYNSGRIVIDTKALHKTPNGIFNIQVNIDGETHYFRMKRSQIEEG